MIDRLLKSHLEPVARSSQKWQLWRSLALCWLALSLLGWAAAKATPDRGWPSAILFLILVVAGIAAAIVVVRRFWSKPLDYKAIARQIEKENPELHALLLTAVEQEPLSEGGQLNYLQQRVVLEALAHHRRSSWAAGMSRRHRIALTANWLALGCFAVALASLFPRLSFTLPGGLWANAEESNGVLVTPGDTNLERGTSLVVLARFNGRLPATAELVVKPQDGSEQRITLDKNLDDPVFGGNIPQLTSNLKYHIEFSGGRTRDFKIGVFEYPRLDHADVTISYPPYTGLAQKTIRNTRRVSAVEGSTLDYTFYLNKAVVSAQLTGTNETPVILTADATNASVYHARILLDVSHRYELALADSDGRANKMRPEFVLEALKNNPPQVRLTAPRGDQSVSPLEEMAFEGTVSGQYGIKSYGISYTLGGGDTKDVELGKDLKAGDRRQFNYMLALESLGAQADQLLSYYVWADDTGPDGQSRRTTSDIYFAEVRPFEQIFRQAQQPDNPNDQNAANNSQNNGGQRGQGNQADNLAQLEKDIVTATFNLQRRENAAKPSVKFKDDTTVVQNSQKDAIDQVSQMSQQVDDPALQPVVQSAQVEMTAAATQLGNAADKNSVSPLRSALASEQAAYQDVLKLSAREFQVQRGQRGQGGQRGQQRAGQALNRQLQQLDLAQNDNQYQTQRQANTDQNNNTPQQQQQLQVANRLKELAQRQQDLNQRIRELQASLQEARTAQERADIQDQLKRLTEEQQNVLADVDELQQRMDQADNQAQANQQPGDQQQQQGDQNNDQLASLDNNQQQDGQQQGAQDQNGQDQNGQDQNGQDQNGQQQPNGQRPGGRQGGQRAGGNQRGGNQRGGAQQGAANQQQQELAQQRDQLQQTRSQVQNAAEQLAQNNPGAALASGTRAQQELQDLQNEVRRMNSAQFSQEMRQMRDDARQLDQNQQQIEQQLNQIANPTQRTLSETDEQRQARLDLSQRLQQQENGISNVVEQMRQVSDQAETSQPVLSQQLYDTIRNTQQDEMNSALDSSSELVRRGFVQQALPSENGARQGITQLRNGVDQAAQTVLGDGTEQLRIAQQELDQLTRELNQQGAGGGLGSNGFGTNGEFASAPGAGQTNGAGRFGRGGQNGQGRNGQPNPNGQQLAENQNGQNPGRQNEQDQGQGQGQGQEPGNGNRAGNRAGQGAQGNRNGGPGGGQGQPGERNGGGGPGNGENPEFARGPGGFGFDTNGNFAGPDGGIPTNIDEATLRQMLAQQQQQLAAAGITNGAGFGLNGEIPTNADAATLRRLLQLQQQQLAAAGNTNGQQAAYGNGPGGARNGGYGGAGNVGGVNDYGREGIAATGEYSGPLVDTNYIAWTDRLRVVEEMVDDVPDLGPQVSQIRDRARELRLAYRRDGKKPDWAVVTEQISKPLADVRNRVDEEILKRTSKEAIVPLDRDPVPSQYSERVRKYYEQLGKSD